MIRQTGVDAVMVGRGALGNPWLFAAIAAALDGGETAPPSPAERRAVITEHLAGLVDLQMRHLKHRHMTRPAAERRATLYFRPHLLNYLHGMDGWTRVRRQLNTMCSVAQVEDALDAVLGEA
jgi:tRNA-dihydrouridine synthase